MGEIRALTDGEIGMLSSVYGDSMDYSRVRVRDGGTVDGSGFTPFNTINIGRDIYSPDFSKYATSRQQGLFVHEAAHAMQTQNGIAALFRGIGPQISATFGKRAEVYDYTDKLAGGVDFEDWNIEEQASYFEDLYKQRVGTLSGTPIVGLPSLEVLEAVDTSTYAGTETLSAVAEFFDSSVHDYGGTITVAKGTFYTSVLDLYSDEELFEITEGQIHRNSLREGQYGEYVDTVKYNQQHSDISNPEGAHKEAYGGGFRFVNNDGTDWEPSPGSGDLSDSGDGEWSFSNDTNDFGGTTLDGIESGSIYPLIVDLDGDGVEISFGEAVFFDWDEDGYKEQTSWAAEDDGFLVLDLNADGSRGAGDGKIDQARELAFALWGNEGDTDLQALARAFDDNNDGKLNASDAVWGELKIWQDLDQDGVTDAGELKSLGDWGISEINLTYDDGSAFSDTDDDITVFGNTLHGLASFTMNGTVRAGGGVVNIVSYQRLAMVRNSRGRKSQSQGIHSSPVECRRIMRCACPENTTRPNRGFRGRAAQSGQRGDAVNLCRTVA